MPTADDFLAYEAVARADVNWKEPKLTCPHIDRLLAMGTLPNEVVQELEDIREINSQLRYGTWALKAEIAHLRRQAEAALGILEREIS